MNSLSAAKRNGVFLFLLFGSLACITVLGDRLPLHIDKRLDSPLVERDFYAYYSGMIHFSFAAPYGSRILVPFLVASLQRIVPASALTIDLIVKFALLIAVEYLFFRYLRFFFDGVAALAGVFLLIALTGFCLSFVLGPSVGETASLFDMLVFIMFLIAAYQGRFGAAFLILFIGMFNRETPLILLPMIFLRELRGERQWSRVILSMMALVIPYAALHLFLPLPAGGGWFLFDNVGQNLPFVEPSQNVRAVISNIHFLALVGPLVVLSGYRFSQQPSFLKTTAITIPFYVVAIYIVGAIIEGRLWLPLLIIVIPLSLHTLVSLFGGHQAEAA